MAQGAPVRYALTALGVAIALTALASIVLGWAAWTLLLGYLAGYALGRNHGERRA